MTLSRRAILATPAVLLASSALGQTSQGKWPTRTVHVIVPVPAGTTPDMLARPLATAFGTVFGETFVVENRSGAGGNLGTDTIAKATDEHTIGLSLNGPIVTAKAIFSKLPYDPEKDLAAICMLARLPQVFVIAADVPVKDLREFIAHGKANPGKLSYGSIGIGSSGHLAMEEVRRAAGIDMTHVPYRGFPQATVDLTANRIQAMICPLSSVTGLAKEGKLKILAGTSEARSPLAPEFPTRAEAGLPGVTSLAWNGLFGPSSMPTELVQRLATEAGKAMADPDVKAKMAAAGIETMAGTPESFRSFLAAERQRWVPVVRRLGIREDG